MSSIKRLFQPSIGSFFLFGPRGTGKSTWVKKNFSNSLYIDLLLPSNLHKYIANPEYLIKQVNPLKSEKTVIIDEVQKAPELLSVVHALIEEKKNIQFILTGSSSRKLKRSGVDLLAGRAVKKTMHPFIAAEIGKSFDLELAMKFGMLPLIWDVENKQEVLDSYIDLYILEEVQFEGLTRNIGAFSRFLSVISFSHGNLLNVNNVARECEVKRSTVENYISILQDLLLANLVPIFSKRAKRILTSHSKFYLFDSGVFRSMHKTGILEKNYVDGNILEGLVFQHLQAWCDYSKTKSKIYYWRTKSGVEVDFIIYGEKGFWAIDVKNNKKVFAQDLKGLINFRQDYPECVPILLYRGKDVIMVKGILCIPCEDFLKNLIPNMPIFEE